MDHKAYSMKSSALVHALMVATGKAATLGSGLVIDLSGGGSQQLITAQHLQGALMARLNDATPPEALVPGAKVRFEKKAGSISTNFHATNHYYHHLEPGDDPLTIRRVWYRPVDSATYRVGQDGEWRWELEFELPGSDIWFFPADQFILATEEATEPT